MCEIFFPNKDYKELDNVYIINNGQIILKYEYNIDKVDNKYYNIILGKQNDNHIFNNEIIIFFEKNKTQRDYEFEMMKKIMNKKYNPNNNNNYIKIDSFLLYKNIDVQQKIKDIHLKERKKYIEFLLNIYLHNKELNNKLSHPLKGSIGELYFTINNEWLNFILEIFEYEKKFLEYIKNENEKNIINQNYSKKENKFDEKFLDEIMNIFPNDYLERINEKIKDNDIIIKLRDIGLCLKKENKTFENKIIYYYDNIGIINDNIINLISELFQIENKEEKHKFVFGENKFMMSFQLENQNSIIIGYLDKNKFFKTELLLQINNNINLDSYFTKFSLNDEFTNYINKLKYDDKMKLALLNKENIEEGVIYNINFTGNIPN